MAKNSALIGRLASLDLLRGAAALAVAIPHYVMLGSQDWPIMQVVSILAVEVFFVLSGFVLAPQILDCVVSLRSSDIGIFLVRRWMRTIPPYLVALVAITMISGHLFSSEFIRYIFYVQNFFSSLPEARDYFAVAWSLSVEEWFYVVFAVLVIAARPMGLRERGFTIAVIVLAIAVIIARTLAGHMQDWDAAIRRVTVFRLDAIAYGFLLYVALDTLERWYSRFANAILSTLAVAATAASAFWMGWLASVDTSVPSRHLYPFAAALFGCTLIFALTFHRKPFQHSALAPTCYYLGKVSYTIYLFHLIVILLLRPHVTHLDLVMQMALYLIALFAFCTFFFFGFERVILAARPHYHDHPARPPRPEPKIVLPLWADATLAPFNTWPARLIALALAIAGGWLCNWSFHSGRTLTFYTALLLTALALIAATRDLRFCRNGVVRTLRIGIGLFALTLPAVDLIYARTLQTGITRPTIDAYSFRQAQADPAAFQAWWSRFTDEFNRGAKADIEQPDPQGTLPFIPRPGARSKFFDGDIRINNLGFRGADFPADKGNAWRIFAIGESPTFGTLPANGQKAWPEVLQNLIDERLTCQRPIQVINAGVVGYSFPSSLERTRRFIVPLKPDMVISYHGFNNLALVDPLLGQLPHPPHWQLRASPLIGEVLFRINTLRYAKRMQAFNVASQAHYSDQYEKLYRAFVELGRTAGFIPVLTNLSMVITDQSPREVIDFYGRVFMPISRIIPAVAEHNRIAAEVAKDTGAPFIDTAPGLAGQWDSDYFYDTVHFTQKGSNVLAEHMFKGILPQLENGPGCQPKQAAK